MDYHGRNTVWGFRDRVLKNLRFICDARDNRVDVHVVTELVTSLLGLIVFPYEEIVKSKPALFKKHKLDDLHREGWPKWTFDIGSSDNLYDLVRHLRHAISHRRVRFSSDSRETEKVDVTFRDRPGENADDNWGTTINAAELQKFVLRFGEFLKPWVRDDS